MLFAGLLTGLDLRNIFGFMLFYKVYYEPLRKMIRVRLALSPPLIVDEVSKKIFIADMIAS